jgi:SdpC family antimicrobial peptide
MRMMNNSVFWKRVLAVVVALLVIPMTTGISLQASPTSQPYDGETVFRGVLLGDGPVAKMFPEIWSSPQLAPYLERAEQQTSAKELAAAKQKIVDLVRTQDPTFFNRFGTEMQSGDHIRIQQAITEAGSRLKKEASAAALASPQVLPEVDIDTEAYLYVAAAIAVFLIAAAAIVIVIVADDPNPNLAASNLQRDVYVDLIAQRLVPRPAKAVSPN